MHTRTHHGLVVSAIGLGCYGLSGAYGPPDVAGYVEVLRRGHALGVTMYDTAHSYGDAERILGEAVAPFRDEVVVATKIGMRYGKTAAQVAIAWVLAQPHVLCALTGPSKPAHLVENLAAADWRIPPDMLAFLDAYLETERKGIAAAQATSARHILYDSLPADAGAAFTDLV